jgi:hypothetical protein
MSIIVVGVHVRVRPVIGDDTKFVYERYCFSEYILTYIYYH